MESTTLALPTNATKTGRFIPFKDWSKGQSYQLADKKERKAANDAYYMARSKFFAAAKLCAAAVVSSELYEVTKVSVAEKSGNVTIIAAPKKAEKPGKAMSAKDAKIAELEAKLAALEAKK